MPLHAGFDKYHMSLYIHGAISGLPLLCPIGPFVPRGLN